VVLRGEEHSEEDLAEAHEAVRLEEKMKGEEEGERMSELEKEGEGQKVVVCVR